MMDVEIVTRHGRRGSLLKNFIPPGVMNEEGGALLSNFDEYEKLLKTHLVGEELLRAGFEMIKKLDFWEDIRLKFIEMNFFDILIGNQDRHPYNWIILFKSTDEQEFATIYDNGASLGFSFDDNQLEKYISDYNKIDKYTHNSTVKAGLFEKKRVKSKEMLLYMKQHYYKESLSMIEKIKDFDFNKYYEQIDKNVLISDIQKEWLKEIIPYRIKTIIKWFEEGE